MRVSAFATSSLPRVPVSMFDRARSEASYDRLSFGCPVLDAQFGGGLVPGMLTELAGESATGKTSLCLQLCLQAQLPLDAGGLAGRAVYLSTESAFAHKRLQQLVEAYNGRYPLTAFGQASMADGVLVQRVQSADELWALISLRLPQALAQSNVRLVVLDSIAAIFRSEFDATTQGTIARSSVMFRLAHTLGQLAERYRCVVLIVNQVSDVIDSEPPPPPLIAPPAPASRTGSTGESDEPCDSPASLDTPRTVPLSSAPHAATRASPFANSMLGAAGSRGGAGAGDGDGVRIGWLAGSSGILGGAASVPQPRMSSGSRVQPSLGLAWASCVNMRLMLTRNETSASLELHRMLASTGPVDGPLPHGNGLVDGDDLLMTRTAVCREMHVEFAPHLARTSVEITIDEGGVRACVGYEQA